MNIMFITQKLIGGGAERVTSVLASELAKDNNVCIVTNRDDDSYEISEKVEIICLNLNKSTNNIHRLKNCLTTIKQLRKIKVDKKIDATISMLNSPNFENVLSRVNDKVIISIRNLTSFQLFGVKAWLSCFAGRYADRVVCLSENVKKDQIANFKTPTDKCITIYNPCDYDLIEKKAREIPEDELFMSLRKRTDCLVITAGRCTYQKGQWHMIRAFKKVVEHNSKAILIILGCGDMDDTLEKLIVDSGLENNVYKLGFKNNIYSYLGNADIFAFTSIFEGFGNILLEAMACGLPIVSCDCNAGPRELLAPGSDLNSHAAGIEWQKYGVLIPSMDGNLYSAKDELTKEELLFADAINKFVDDKELLNVYRKKSEERIKDFSVDKIVRQWKEIIE